MHYTVNGELFWIHCITQYRNTGTRALKMYSERMYCDISTLSYVSQEYVLCIFIYLVHVSPVLAVVIEALPHHTHDFREGHNIVCQISNLWHQRAARAPWVIGCRLSNLDNNTARDKLKLSFNQTVCDENDVGPILCDNLIVHSVLSSNANSIATQCEEGKNNKWIIWLD